MEPVVVSLSEKFAGKVLFYMVNVNERSGWEVGRALAVRYHPSYLMIDTDGERAAQWFGTFKEEQLTALIQEVLNKKENL